MNPIITIIFSIFSPPRLPDGRLMKVSYYVDGDSGFVPTIEYTDDYNPSF